MKNSLNRRSFVTGSVLAASFLAVALGGHGSSGRLFPVLH
jgi:hypothetical protein